MNQIDYPLKGSRFNVFTINLIENHIVNKKETETVLENMLIGDLVVGRDHVFFLEGFLNDYDSYFIPPIFGLSTRDSNEQRRLKNLVMKCHSIFSNSIAIMTQDTPSMERLRAALMMRIDAESKSK